MSESPKNTHHSYRRNVNVMSSDKACVANNIAAYPKLTSKDKRYLRQVSGDGTDYAQIPFFLISLQLLSRGSFTAQ